MATLTGELISETYDSLLKVTDNNTITGIKKRITDGFGNDIPLLLSSTDLEIDGTLILSALTNLAPATKFLSLKADNTVGFRTSSELLSDIGGASSSSISGTTGRLSKFTSSGAVGNSILNEIGNSIHLTDGTSSYASFGINNPGIDNDAYIGSTINNDFLIKVNNTEALRIDTAFRLKIANIQNALGDTDKFLVSEDGVVKYRSGLELLTDIGAVPYIGAISDVNLGEFGLQTGNIEFDLTPTTIPTTVGSMAWNDSAGTVDLKLKGGNVTLQIGQETVARVVNKTATNITLLESNYQVVRVTGAQGQRPKVDLAQANNDLNSTTTLGLVTETILINQEGFITTSGQVQGINTTGTLQGETWADGDVLYLSGTIPGQITNIKPLAPIHTVIIGFVEYAHITQGKIFVKVDNGYELEELHNVSAIAPNNNEVLTYDSATLLWKPKTVSTALGYTPVPTTRTITINGTSQDLSANRTYSVGTVTSVSALTLGTSGTDLNSTVENSNTTPVITLNVPDASATARGVVTIGSQTFAGAKSFSSDITVNSMTMGRGTGGNIYNMAIGQSALLGGGGSYNMAIGYQALQAVNTGSFNIAFGALSLTANTSGSENTAFGANTLRANTSGVGNSAFGRDSLRFNTIGLYNMAIGQGSLYFNTSGNFNVAIGQIALYANTTGIYNSAFGTGAGRYTNSGAVNQTSSYSIYVGNDTRASASGNENEIVIGSAARGGGSNSVTLGNTNILTTNLKGNVGIGYTTNPNLYNLDVNGTANIVGQLKLGSTITNGTYTYTLPSATGVLALTSELSGYVPYTGATGAVNLGTNNGITLADNGTNSSISISSSSTGSGAIIVDKSGIGTGIRVNNNGTGFGFYANNSSNGYGITIGNSSTGKGLYIDNAPAATGDPFVYSLGGVAFVKAKIDYLGNITGNSATLITNTSIGYTTNPSVYKLDVNGTGKFQTVFSENFWLQNSGSGTGLSLSGDNLTLINYGTTSSLILGTNGLPRLTIASTGAATFSSTVQSNGTNGFILTNGSTWNLNTDATYFNISETNVATWFKIAKTTGAATFSSTVSATQAFLTGTSTITNNDQSLVRFKMTNTGGATSGGYALIAGIANESQDGFSIYDYTNSKTRLTITSGGNVGIGTTTPNNKLVISNGGAQGLEIGADATYNVNLAAYNRATMAYIPFQIDASKYSFLTGNVLIGTTSDNGAKLQVSGVGTFEQAGSTGVNSICIGLNHFYTNTKYIDFNWYGTSIGSITNAGGTSVAYNTSSDYRLKQDLKEYSGIDLISKIKTYDYEWKSNNTRSYGVLAHELQEVIPNAVTGEKDAEQMQGVDYSKLVPILIKAIQELNEKIIQLENK